MPGLDHRYGSSGSTTRSTSGSTRANAPPGRSSTGHHPVNQGRPGNQPGGRPNLPSNPMPDPNKARIERELQELLNPQQNTQQNTQQDIINRNNAARIAKMEKDKKEAAIARAKEIAAGAPAAEKVWDPKADDWAKDYSHSTRDVRAAPGVIDPLKKAEEGTREEFRQRTGSKVQTEAENLARWSHSLTGNPNYLNMPIFNPKGLYEARLDPVTGEWSADPGYDELFAAANEAAKTGNNELYFELMGKLNDISAGNPNQQFQEGFGTGYDEWYTPPAGLDGQNDQGGYYGWDGSGGSQGGSGYGYGYGGDDDPLPRGYQRAKFAPGTLQEQVNQNYMRLAGLRKKRGGIVSLLELR